VGGVGFDVADHGEVFGVIGCGCQPGAGERGEVVLQVGDLGQVAVHQRELRVSDARGALFDDRSEQVCLVAEVVVDGAGGHARGGTDGVDARPAVAVAGEELECPVEDLAPLIWRGR
jgi:hypothetical protein